MPTKAIKNKRKDEQGMMAGNWRPIQEQAPSVIRGEEPTTVRFVALFSLVLIFTGGLAMILRANGSTSMLAVLFGQVWGMLMVMLGIGGLLLHSFVEKDFQYRRLYGLLGLLLLGAGVLFRLAPFGGYMGGMFVVSGAPCLGLALCFLVAFIRNEEEVGLRDFSLNIVGITGAVLIVVGFTIAVADPRYLWFAFVHLVLGLIYAGMFVSLQSVSSPRGYWAGIALGAVGGLMVVIALGKLSLPSVFQFVQWQTGQPAAPFMFIYLGLEYILLSILFCSDYQLVVITRRELLSYLYSPVAYIVMVASVIFATTSFLWTTLILLQGSLQGRGFLEPIVRQYIISIFPFICGVFSVPIITMRLLSEEKRSGTLEVLLTAPVNEFNVVVSKFLAALRFYLFIWYPWAAYMVALQWESSQEFDYRPLLAFLIVLVFTGAGFVSMGLFFSSLTRNQIASAMLTFAGMLLFSTIAFLQDMRIHNYLPGGEAFWNTIIPYVSYFTLWIDSLSGIFAPRYLLFHISITIIFLFLTVKVLESRKWK